MKHILILAANPKGTTHLRLDHEVRDIEQALRESSLRDNFELHQCWALRPRDLQRAMLEVQPNIVHFCGHGEGKKGIALEDASGKAKLVPTAALANLFALCAEQIECVLLNACYAEVQANAIVESIDYVIGMRKAVPDDVAIAFSTGFYKGLGAGQSIETAFTTGCNNIQANEDAKIEPQTKPQTEPRRASYAPLPGEIQLPSSAYKYKDIPVLKRKA